MWKVLTRLLFFDLVYFDGVKKMSEDRESLRVGSSEVDMKRLFLRFSMIRRT